MFARNTVLCGVCLFLCAGCSTTSCCNWWGRNTDGSTNLGRKPTPVQAGPIAGTYSQPGNTVSPQVQPPVTGMAPPLNTPVQQGLPPESSSPLLSPPTPPTGIVTGQYQPTGNNGVVPPNQLPPAGLTTLPENMPSMKPPTVPTTQVPMPQVQAPQLDLTIPGATSPAAPMPMLLAPANTVPGNSGGTVGVAPPTIEMSVIAEPTVNKPIEIAPPKVAGAKAPSLNPGTTPPPLPPNPTIPVLDKK